MEIADQRYAAAQLLQPLGNMRHRSCRFRGIDGDANQFGASRGQRLHLACGGLDAVVCGDTGEDNGVNATGLELLL